MPGSKSPQRGQEKPKTKDRRLGASAVALRRAWRWLKGVLLRRPLGIVGEKGHRRLGFVERRRAPADAMSVAALRAELRTRLLTIPAEQAQHTLSHLIQVHDELGKKGWPGVAALPPTVLIRALRQARDLARESPSPGIKLLVDKLHALQPPPPAAATAAEPELNEGRRLNGPSLEISEASQEDFEASKRSWFGDLPPEPEPQAPETQK